MWLPSDPPSSITVSPGWIAAQFIWSSSFQALAHDLPSALLPVFDT
jgi:hypothetical protein